MVYFPAFQRYEPRVTAALNSIERAKALVETARILPPQEDILRKTALAESVHYSNLIEGNELPVVEAQRAVEHELEPTTKAKLELVNYVEALEFLDANRSEIEYSPAFLKELHRLLTKGIGRAEGRFKPHHEGEWRDGDVMVADAIGIFHEAPPAADVDRLMTERLSWIEEKRRSDEYFGPILAGIAHFEVAEVHPFADGNGRAARLLAVAVLMREGYLERLLFSPERYYAEDRDAYLDALRAIKRTRNLNDWLAYYTRGLAAEFERVAVEVERLNRLTARARSVLQLTAHQQIAIAALTTEERSGITRAEFEQLTGLGKTQAASQLQELVKARVLRARGTGRSTRYVLAGAPPSEPQDARHQASADSPQARGRQRVWTEERIQAELSALVEDLGHWPTHADFRERGLMPLYVAASKAGGIARWRRELEASPSRTQKREKQNEAG